MQFEALRTEILVLEHEWRGRSKDGAQSRQREGHAAPRILLFVVLFVGKNRRSVHRPPLIWSLTRQIAIELGSAAD